MAHHPEYLTQKAAARAGVVTKEMREVCELENISSQLLLERICDGTIALPANKLRPFTKAVAFGKGLSTKVNVNLGVSEDACDFSREWEKVEIALAHGADAIMDLSVGKLSAQFRKELRGKTHLSLGTVPIYDAALRYKKNIAHISIDEWFAVVEDHAKDGVDFMTIHAGLTRACLERLERKKRLTHVVSRGGSILMEWMLKNNRENPFYEHYDRLLDLCQKYDITLSLGDGLRPGSLADSTDAAQIQELIMLGELTRSAWDRDVQVIIEGPGHIPLHEVAANITVAKKLTHNAPLYVLGPLVCDIGAGYDHITAAIGGALAASSGADFLCYVTPAEHLCLPSVEDVQEGLIATRIAAHAGDLAKGVPGAMERDHAMSAARGSLDWEKMFSLALCPEKARARFESQACSEPGACSMCGSLCAMKRSRSLH